MEDNSSNRRASAAASAEWRTAFTIGENVADDHQSHRTAVGTNERSVRACCLKYWLFKKTSSVFWFFHKKNWKHYSCYFGTFLNEGWRSCRSLYLMSTRSSFLVRTQEFVCSGCNCVISDLGGCVFVLQMFFKVASRAVRAASGSSSDLRSRADNVSPLTPRKGSLSVWLHKVVAFGTWKCAKDVGGNKNEVYVRKI